MSRIYVGGSFDIFHGGHVALLRYAKSLADQTIVAVNSDAFYEFYRHSKPVVPEYERLEIVQACRYTDEAFLMPGHEHQRPILERLKPTYILHGDDWMGDSLLTQLGIDHDFLFVYGIEMKYMVRVPGMSSRGIKARIA